MGRIEILNTWRLKDFFESLEKGNLKIPRFQRGYVWEKSKIVKLLNSIHQEYPIGSFFIWEAGTGYAHFCREIAELELPHKPQYGVYQFILDGQQRITSLYIALKKKTFGKVDYSTICFNLEKNEFKLQRLKSEKHNVPAWKLFDTAEFSKVYSEYDKQDKAMSENWLKCQMTFTSYPISTIISREMDLDEVVEIFECINQGGKRLSLFDLVHASAWSPNFDLREKIDQFNNDVNIKQFGQIVPEVFTQSLALNAYGDCKNKNQLNLSADVCIRLWDSTINCIRLAIDYVKTLGVRSIEFIPYSSFLAVIQCYFIKSGYTAMKPEHTALVERWFWTSTFSNRYSSSSLTRMKEDSDWIKKMIEGARVPNSFGIALSVNEIVKISMKTTSVIKNGIFCLYALKHPVDFSNGLAVTLDKSYVSKSNAKENHHFFPYSLREKFNTSEDGINSIVNLAFISQSLNREISATMPSDYIDKYSNHNHNIETHLETHFIDAKVLEAIEKDDYNAFLVARATLIMNRILEVTATPVNNIPSSEDIIEDDFDEVQYFEQEAVNE